MNQSNSLITVCMDLGKPIGVECMLLVILWLVACVKLMLAYIVHRHSSMTACNQWHRDVWGEDCAPWHSWLLFNHFFLIYLGHYYTADAIFREIVTMLESPWHFSLVLEENWGWIILLLNHCIMVTISNLAEWCL